MVSLGLLRRTLVPASGCLMFLCCIYSVVHNGTNIVTEGSPREAGKDLENNVGLPGVPGGEKLSGGARHVHEVAGDYEEVEYTSSIHEKADVDAILEQPWVYNRSAVENARKELFTFFNPYKIITMTSDDVVGGRLQRFYRANAIPVNIVPPGISRLLPRRQLFSDVRYQTCAVVGNGGILLNSSCGESINDMDFVIRCNFAEMSGFESDVGTKTDVVTFNPSIVDTKFDKLESDASRRTFLERLEYYGKYVLWLPVFSRHILPANVRSILTFYEKNSERLKDVQLAFPGDIQSEILDFWMSKGVDEERISTGLLMYIIASIICDRIHMYGFYPFPEYEGRPIPYHYEDVGSGNDNKSDFVSNYRRFHRLPDEFVYLKKMHRRGALQLHIGECDR